MKPIIKNLPIIAALAAMVGFASCKAKQEAVIYTGEQTVVYKTRADYSKNVPVTLSADKSQIVAYPGIKDVYYRGQLAYPTALADGYWLDNRGINPNSAFLKITYDEFVKLSEPLTLDQMGQMILDKDPFTEVYNLGNRSRFKDEVAEINKVIRKGQLNKYKRLK